MSAKDDDPDFDPRSWQDGNPEFDWLGPRGLPVENSKDLERILKLPRREPVQEGSATAEALIALAMQKYSLGPRTCRCAELDNQIKAGNRTCIKEPLWIQAWMLYEIEQVGGLLGSVSVGAGKTLVGVLSALALRDCKIALLLVPSSVLEQLVDEYKLIGQHFRVPGLVAHLPKGTWKAPPKPRPAHLGGGDEPVLHVMAHAGISSTRRSGWIENLKPDAIIIDELDAFKDRESSRTLRLLRFYKENWRTTRFLGWTGSLFDKVIEDADHLSGLALREGSPMPLDHEVTQDWGRCVNAIPNPCPPGVLERFLVPGEEPTPENVRRAYQKCLAETPGFIIVGGRPRIVAPTTGQEVGLTVRERQAPPIPPSVAEALELVRGSVRPDGVILVEGPMEIARYVKDVATGMYYKWKFPPVRVRRDGKLVIDHRNGTPQKTEHVARWRAARRSFHSEVNEKKRRGELNLDSAKLLEDAARRAWGDLPKDPRLPEWRAESWPEWRDIKDTVLHEDEAVRIDPFLVDDAIRWALERPGIVWYGMTEFAEWMQERARQFFGVEIPIYDGGTGAEIIKELGNRPIIASLKAHGRGRDKLQFAFHRQLMAQMAASDRAWQQCLDSKTEILTNKGWLGIDAAWSEPALRVAAYSPEDGGVRWSTFKRVERLLGDEPMYGIQNPHLDIRVTAGHRMLVSRYRRRGPNGRDGSYHAPWEFVTADSLPTHARIPLAGNEEAPGAPLTDAELTFLGLFMSDGCKSRGNIILYQSERYPTIIKLIEETLASCRFHYVHRIGTAPSNFGPRRPIHRWTICKGIRKRTDGLRGWGDLEPFVSKGFPETLDDMTAGQLRVFLYGLWAGDGAKTAGTYAYNRYRPSTATIATKRDTVMNRVQSLCARRGLRCNVSRGSGVWMLHISDDTYWSVHRYASDTRPRWGELASTPGERVWCVEVDTGAIVTRRNGKVAIVGNCMARLHRRGQDKRNVETDVYLHTPELRKTFREAMTRGKFVQDMTTEERRLLIGWEAGGGGELDDDE